MGVILVTGASRGIGRGVALELSRGGHTVAVHYNGNREAAESTCEACAATAADAAVAAEAAAGGIGPRIFQADISAAADRERLVADVLSAYGRIDGLVNNAGIAPRKRDDIVYAEQEIFDEVLAVNLRGPYFLTQLVARHWLESAGVPDEGREPPAAHQGRAERPSPRGRIVFVTSVSATMASVQRGEYCISKAGLAMAAQLFAARLAGDGIVVCEVRPGIIRTDMTAGVTAKYDALIAEGLVPQRRWGYPEDIGAAVRAVMDGAFDFSTGTVIHTDGGLHLSRL